MKPLFDEYLRRNAKFGGVRLNVENVLEWNIVHSENKPTDNTTVELTFDRAIDENGNVDLSRLNERLPRITKRTVVITRPTVRELLLTTGIIDAEGALSAPVNVLEADTVAQATSKFKAAFADLCDFGSDISVIYINSTTIRIISKPNALGCRGQLDVTAALGPESP